MPEVEQDFPSSPAATWSGVNAGLCSNSCRLVSFGSWSEMDGTTAYVLLVILVATLIRSAFGFGEALVAVPLLAIRLPISVAAPLAVLVSITVAAVIIAQDWRHIHLRSAGWLVAATLFGIPLGLDAADAGQSLAWSKGTLAVIIMSFSAYALIGRRPPELHSDNRIWLLACGFCAGRTGRSVRHERASAGDLWSDAPLVGATFSRDSAGILSACQPDRHDRLLAGRTVGCRGDSLLPAVAARGHSGDPAGACGKSSPARRRVSQVRSRWTDIDWGDAVGAGDSRLLTEVGCAERGYSGASPPASLPAITTTRPQREAHEHPVAVNAGELREPIDEIERGRGDQPSPRDFARDTRTSNPTPRRGRCRGSARTPRRFRRTKRTTAPAAGGRPAQKPRCSARPDLRRREPSATGPR